MPLSKGGWAYIHTLHLPTLHVPPNPENECPPNNTLPMVSMGVDRYETRWQGLQYTFSHRVSSPFWN